MTENELRELWEDYLGSPPGSLSHVKMPPASPPTVNVGIAPWTSAALVQADYGAIELAAASFAASMTPVTVTGRFSKRPKPVPPPAPPPPVFGRVKRRILKPTS
jgi:hypothetical protein